MPILLCAYGFVLLSTGFPMAAAALIFMTTAIMLQSVSCAPLISKNDTQDTNQIKDGVTKNATQNSSLLIDGLFEGDLAITEEFIRQHYNFSSISKVEEYMSQEDEDDVATETTEGGQKLNKRAAKRNLLLWTNAVVPYKFSSSIQSYGEGGRHSIREAMDHWEDRTCLRFTLRNGESDYVEYINTDNTCSSSWIGRKGGGKQTVSMAAGRGCGIGTIVHEIGHAIGFWHEQSRPDRDRYIQINLNNAEDNDRKRDQFDKRNTNEVDSRGSEYDYGSVMHYQLTKYARCCGLQTMSIKNWTAYRAQGSPTIGHWSDQTGTEIGSWSGLSVRDAQQTNLIYSCPKRGVTGLLVVHVGTVDLYQTLIQYGMLLIPMSKSQQLIPLIIVTHAQPV